jgi:hypothetical protein
MLEDEQSFKHGGGDCYSKYYDCLKVWRSIKNDE